MLYFMKVHFILQYYGKACCILLKCILFCSGRQSVLYFMKCILFCSGKAKRVLLDSFGSFCKCTLSRTLFPAGTWRLYNVAH